MWVGVGSVDETPRLAGASHYLEHLLFKGTKYRTGYEIADAVDAVGGELNAFTSHEYTCYYARILAEEAQLAVGLVCEVVLDATIAAADVDVERQVILEEIAMRDDDPEDTLADVFAGAVFAGHPVASPVIGTVETIERDVPHPGRRLLPPPLQPGQDGRRGGRRRRSRRRAALGPGRLPRPAVRRGRGRRAGRVPTAAAAEPTPLRQAAVVERDTEQAHLCIGVPSGDRNDPDRTALAVLSARSAAG